jgi:hypothetical protein
VIRWVVLPSISSALVLLALVFVCRWIWRIERRLGLLVAAGLAIRLILASVLFWVSYLSLPPLASLQLGGGFWKMALDAQEYYALGLHAVEQGIFSVPLVVPSRTYVLALGAWMSITGTSPFSAVLLNATCYVGTCAAIVAVLRGLDKSQLMRAGFPIVATIAASPMLLFVSTQARKTRSSPSLARHQHRVVGHPVADAPKPSQITGASTLALGQYIHDGHLRLLPGHRHGLLCSGAARPSRTADDRCGGSPPRRVRLTLTFAVAAPRWV